MYHVYWNLQKKMFSVKYRGIVIGHISSGLMHHVKFKVSDKGRQRVLKEKKKNVHAYVVAPEIYTVTKQDYALFENLGFVTYNPYRNNRFFYCDTKAPVFDAPWVYLNTWVDADGNIVPTVAVGYYKKLINLTEHNLITTHQNFVRKMKVTKTSGEVRRVKNIMTSLDSINAKVAKKKAKPKSSNTRLRWYDKGLHLTDLSSAFNDYEPLKKGERVRPGDIYVHLGSKSHVGRKNNGSVTTVKQGKYPCGLVAAGHGVISDRLRVFRKQTDKMDNDSFNNEQALYEEDLRNFAFEFLHTAREIEQLREKLYARITDRLRSDGSFHLALDEKLESMIDALNISISSSAKHYLTQSLYVKPNKK